MHEYMHICKAENDCVVMGDLSLLLFYFFMVTFVVFNVPIKDDFFYLCVNDGIT